MKVWHICLSCHRWGSDRETCAVCGGGKVFHCVELSDVAASLVVPPPSDFDALLEHHQATERELAALRASLVVPQEAPRWQPIETAPKNEILILLLSCAGACAGVFDRGSGLWISAGVVGDDGMARMGVPTHWMPLPVAPADAPAPQED